VTEDQFKQRLEQNNAALMEYIDARLEENNDQLVKRVDERVEEKTANLFGKLSRHFDSQFEELRADLAICTDRIYTTLDGITERLDADDKEWAAINAEQERQNRWIGQLAKATGTKLVPEQ
jgi:CRP-like cAMP-binding protein